jgi:hypothetical protein
MVKVTVCGLEVVFTSVAEGIVAPVPLAASPCTLPLLKSPLVLDHVKAVPATLELKVIADMAEPEQTGPFPFVAEVFKTGFTVTVILETQPPALELTL